MTSLRNAISRPILLLAILLWALGARAEHYTLPLLVPAGTSAEPQGVLRILNGTAESSTVEIYAIDDSGTRSGPATFMLNASVAVEFTATDLQSGNATMGLTGGIGANAGDARLEIETDLDIVPLAFVRAADGTLSAIHDTVRRVSSADESGVYTYEVPIFNLSTEMTQVSRLRLINPGDVSAAVTISGRDDTGATATGGAVTLTLAAGGSKTLTAQQLEAGDTDVTGQLGAGTGKWRLTVSSDQPLQVVNIVASTAGYWNNLSTTAVAGAAPADHAGLNERFVGNSVIYETSSGPFTLNAMDGNRFTETDESDGVTTTYMGGYSYTTIGPDAGQLTLNYDDGDACRANLYFSSRTSGWFASNCIGSDYPADGTWLGGSWSVDPDEDDGDEVVDTTYAVNEMLPGVPTSGSFVPSRTGGGSEITATADSTTIRLNENAYFELSDGTRYTCTSADGCTVVNGTVTRGTIAGRASGSGAGEVDQFPTFRTAVAPGDQTYTAGTAIDTLTLPEAISGNAPLTYSLAPNVPSLTFNATMRRLTGTPSTLGSYAMTYTVTDEDGDTDALRFTISVSDETGSLGDCYVGLMVGIGQRCTYPGTTDAFSVNVRGRGSFLTLLAGIRIRINNETINGRVYDFEASHQGDGVWRIDRVAGSAEPPTDGEDHAKTYMAGDAIAALPIGVWRPDFAASGTIIFGDDHTRVQLHDGGYFDHGSYRYTCHSTDGCEVRNQDVVSGTVLQTMLNSETDMGGTAIGIGGGLTPPDSASPEGSPIPVLAPRTVGFGPAEAGKRAQDRIVLTVQDNLGRPVGGAKWRWNADEQSGWLYPREGITAEDGRIAATWVPGSPGSGILTLTVSLNSMSLVREYRTESVAPPRPPLSAVSVQILHNDRANGYSIDMTPLTEPRGTYYAAIYWDGGYAGLQRAGYHYDRQLQFSVWDSPGGGNAQVIEPGEGVQCGFFGGEGTGQACALEYPWSVGSTYRFEVTEEELNGGSAISLHVTELASGERKFIGTLRYATVADLRTFSFFVEDFLASGPPTVSRRLFVAQRFDAL